MEKKDKKESLTLEQLQSLCNYIDDIYTQKQGQDYLDALAKVYPLNNKNDNPFTKEDIQAQPTLKEFKFEGKNDFKKICELEVTPMQIINGKRKNEKIQAIHFVGINEEDIFNNSLGVAYIITCTIEGQEHIIKFGQTRTTYKKRLGSYNCGVVFNWRTASTTNIKMLQSMVTTRLPFNLYLYDCNTDEDAIYVLKDWHGETSVPFASPKSLAVEDIMVKKFIEQFNKKPLANVQTDATQVD